MLYRVAKVLIAKIEQEYLYFHRKDLAWRILLKAYLKIYPKRSGFFVRAIQQYYYRNIDARLKINAPVSAEQWQGSLTWRSCASSRSCLRASLYISSKPCLECLYVCSSASTSTFVAYKHTEVLQLNGTDLTLLGNLEKNLQTHPPSTGQTRGELSLLIR